MSAIVRCSNRSSTRCRPGLAAASIWNRPPGRLALAEANLLTETSNLHDVSARFQRIVGEGPAKEMEEAHTCRKGIPVNMAAAQKLAQQRNPTLHAAIENVRCRRRRFGARNAAYQPRLDLRLQARPRRQSQRCTSASTDSQDRGSGAELEPVQRLFGCGAFKRQYVEQHYVCQATSATKPAATCARRWPSPTTTCAS